MAGVGSVVVDRLRVDLDGLVHGARERTLIYILLTSTAFLFGFLCGSLLARAARDEDARHRARYQHPTSPREWGDP